MEVEECFRPYAVGLGLNVDRRPNCLLICPYAFLPVCGQQPEFIRKVKDPGFEVEVERVDLVRVLTRAAAGVAIFDASIAVALGLNVRRAGAGVGEAGRLKSEQQSRDPRGCARGCVRDARVRQRVRHTCT